MAVESLVERLQTLHPKKIDLSLERMWRLLAQLDHPERQLPPVIHVAGTNGKGSTIAFMRGMLEAAGKSVHVYTSPNLVRMNERFRLGSPGGGKLVSDTQLEEALVACEHANKGEPITIFEITTAAGILLFAQNPADMLLLEVGLGGRLDATNVVSQPCATIITPVSIDHIEHLGATLGKIAAEKAGIIKAGVPVVIGPQTDEALDAIAYVATRLRAPMKIAGEHWVVSEERGRLVYQDEHGLMDLPSPRLVGRYQFDNAGAAIAALRNVPELKLPVGAFEQGIVNADWPARMQRITQGALLAELQEGAELWLDGSHNAEGGRVAAASVADIEERVSRPLILIIGMLMSKDCESYLKNFTGLARRVIAVPIAGQEKALPPDTLANAARRAGLAAEIRTDLHDALAAIRRLDITPAPRILIAGSLYLAGEVLRENGTIPR